MPEEAKFAITLFWSSFIVAGPIKVGCTVLAFCAKTESVMASKSLILAARLKLIILKGYIIF
jgi:hypothetical protein